MHICLYILTDTWLYILNIFLYICLNLQTHTHIRICVPAFTYIHVYIYSYLLEYKLRAPGRIGTILSASASQWIAVFEWSPRRASAEREIIKRSWRKGNLFCAQFLYCRPGGIVALRMLRLGHFICSRARARFNMLQPISGIPRWRTPWQSAVTHAR